MYPESAYKEVAAYWEQAGKFFRVFVESAYGIVWLYLGNSETANGFYFETQEAADRLVRRIEEKGEINLEHWYHYRTCYGSRAYVDNDVEGQILEVEHRFDGAPGYREDHGAFRDLFKCM